MFELRPVASLSLLLPVTLLLARVAHGQQALAAPGSSRTQERLLGHSVTPPQKAGILSAVVPGAGQVYNHQLWKLPLVYGALGGATYLEVLYWRRYQEYRRGYEARKRLAQGELTAVDTGRNSGKEPTDAAQKSQFYRYRTVRDSWMGITAALYGGQILDAIAAAHLRNFDVSENLALHLHPTMLATGITPVAFGVQVQLHVFPHVSSQLLP
ncbi:hypothetical protein K3G63_21170 [Hymenobacter sp. HSC-4F20]|uniref:DUF5683 domain-containing protein n=1 Tax=Hymenobacter sp. HSC-4F20 TaxID=2864135 RepID=UPI001C730D14|nr:hypothetical protein [Hymenobacter sp. HSC-4F20]